MAGIITKFSINFTIISYIWRVYSYHEYQILPAPHNILNGLERTLTELEGFGL